jgi:hypothetical protein
MGKSKKPQRYFGSRFRMAAILILLCAVWSFCLPMNVHAQSIVDVNCGGVKIGTVDTNYYRVSGDGAELSACFKKTKGCPYTCCHKFRIFQVFYHADNIPLHLPDGSNVSIPFADPPNGGWKEKAWDKKPWYNEPGESGPNCPFPYYFYDGPNVKFKSGLAMAGLDADYRADNDIKIETWIVCVDETNKKMCGLAHFRWGYKRVGTTVTKYAINTSDRLTNAEIKTALKNSNFNDWTFSDNPKDCCPLSGEDAYDREDFHCNADSANDFHITYHSDTKMELESHHDGPFPKFDSTQSDGGKTWNCTWSGSTVFQCNWISVGVKFKQKRKNTLLKKNIYWTFDNNPVPLKDNLPGVGFDVSPPYGEGPVTYTLYNETDSYLEVWNLEIGFSPVAFALEDMEFGSGELGPQRPDSIPLPAGGFWDTTVVSDDLPFYLLAQGDVVSGSTESHFVQQHEHPTAVETFFIRHDASGYVPDQGNPTGTFWTELFPGFLETWIISEWIDNDDGYLSECDNVLFTNIETSDTSWEHIERVMPTMTAINYMEPGTIYYLESIADNPTIDPIDDPVGTYWNEVYPGSCILYEIMYWEDNGNGYLDSCDYIGAHILSGPDSCTTVELHIEGMATDIISDPIRFEECSGTCGDANNDADVNVSDAVFIINYVFVGGGEPQPVLACGDANNDGVVNVSDAVSIINYVFVGGTPPEDCAPGSPDWYNGNCCPFE